MQLVEDPVGVAAAGALADVADPGPHLRGLGDDVVARHLGRSRRGLQQGGEHPQRRRLPGTVGAEERDEFTLPHVDIDRPDGFDDVLAAPEGPGEASSTDHRSRVPHSGTDAYPCQVGGSRRTPVGAAGRGGGRA
ncbi:hypothetical protein SDC9_76834 [bioreactor metagenome]|uniref:Uncharacterized protein n=1 Tax=bioreactor metagenome TaxID=1076179 RepID=A0A644YP49_9ZZZZ